MSKQSSISAFFKAANAILSADSAAHASAGAASGSDSRPPPEYWTQKAQEEDARKAEQRERDLMRKEQEIRWGIEWPTFSVGRPVKAIACVEIGCSNIVRMRLCISTPTLRIRARTTFPIFSPLSPGL